MIRSMLGKKFPSTRLAMTIGLGSSLLAMGAAYAQQVSDPASSQAPETAAADRVLVTGSNIPTSEEVGASPVDTVDQATRDRTGQEDVESVLTRSNPAISSGGGNLGQSNASINSGSTLGGSTISVHGLPTLVLLDGRRLTDSSASAVGSTFSDVNLFPSALVKRIEVLKDGASAIYGTEAVGGVVNVILDQEFQGFEFSARYGFTEKSDVKNQRYSAIFGFGNDKTHIVVGGEYNEQDPIFNRDRQWAQPSFGTTTYPGEARFTTTNAAGGTSELYYHLAPGINSPNDVVAPGSITLPTAAAPGNPIPGVYVLQGGNTIGASSGAAVTGFDLSRFTNITLDQNRTNAFASADHTLIDKHLIAFADFLYANDYSQSALNAQPVNTNAANGIVIPAGSPYNPFTTTIDGSSPALIDNRFVSVAPRVYRSDTNFYRIVAGLKGEIIPNYDYEVAFNSSQDETSFRNPGLIILSNLNAAIAGGYDAAGNPVAGGKYSLVAGNIQPALDFFAVNPIPGSTTNISGNELNDLTTKFEGMDGKITAFPFNLPAGPVGFAGGGEFRHEVINAVGSPNIFINASSFADTHAGRYVTAGFGELQVPLVSPDMHIPFLYRADLNGAVRYEKYDPGDSTWVPKVGFDLSPIKDVTLRGTFSRSFIAPTLYETQGPTTEGSTNVYNIGGGSEQANQIITANPALGNEKAQTYTAGIVISPHQIEGLTLNADFFHVEEQGLTGTFAVAAIQSVNALGTASPYYKSVGIGNFPSVGGPSVLVTGPGQLVGNGDDTFVDAPISNLGGARIGGIDFGAHYNKDFGAFGQASIGIDGTYYLQYKVSEFQNSEFYDVIGFYTGQASEVQQYHLTPQVAYTIKGFTASAIGNYIPSTRDAHNISIDPTPGFGGADTDKPGTILAAGNGQDYLSKIRDYYTIDLLFSYEFHYTPPVAPAPASKEAKDGKGGGGKEMATQTTGQTIGTDSPLRFLDGLKLSFGIENVTNARPPLIEGSPDSTNTDASIYDPYQRQYYFVITKKF